MHVKKTHTLSIDDDDTIKPMGKTWFTNECKHRNKHSITMRIIDKLTSIRSNAITGGRGKAVDCILLKGSLEE